MPPPSRSVASSSSSSHQFSDAPMAPPPPAAPVDPDTDKKKSAKMAALRSSIMADDIAAATTEASGSSNVDASVVMEDTEMSEEEKMARLMGFSGFNTTKNTKVADNYTGAAKGASQRKKERKYRQYMNRKGGFNRPLAKMG